MTGSWVGIDPGEKRIGVARSNALGLAHPHGIVSSPEELVKLLREWPEGPLSGVVVGLPRNMDGTIGPIARRSLELVVRLRRELPLAVQLWDERLTSAQIERSPAGRGSGPIDDRAAALILQSFLDAGAPVRPDPPELEEISSADPPGKSS